MFDDYNIREAINDTNVSVHEMSFEDTCCIMNEIKNKYKNPDVDCWFLWQELKTHVSRSISDGWQMACNYVGMKSVILILRDRENSEYGMWRFQNGDDMYRVIVESYAYEFSITDDDTSYLICYNDHNYLIGIGACESWLEKLYDNC